MPHDFLPRPEPVQSIGDALFLDFDGTLAPLVQRPGDTILAISVRRALIRLRRLLAGRIAIVSGRSVAVIDRMVAIDGLPVAGIHGLERRSANGIMTRVKASDGIAAARIAFGALVTRLPQLLLEDKGPSLALHYRMAPDLAPIAREAAEAAADRHGLSLLTGKMVVEVHEPGPDKGAAVRAYMAEPPFEGARPIYVGDDATDESAFEAVAALGGFGVLVGLPRSTAAQFRLADVQDVEAWLSAADMANAA